MDDRIEKEPSAWAEQDKLRYWLALSGIKGLGPKSFQILLERYQSPKSVFEVPFSELRTLSGVSEKLAKKISEGPDLDRSEKIIETCHSKNIQVVTKHCPEYPTLLQHIYDPPPLFFKFGSFAMEDQQAIAIVGSRNATRYGLQAAKQLSRDLAKSGVTVVSGLARGIDSVAHKAALEAGGRTIAVLGSGLMNLYPPENASLAREIGKQGVVLSENDLKQPPHSTTFPRRNRIISGLSAGIVVVEAASRSGALITARMAMEQNRDVFAVPGRIDSPNSAGCNDLLKDGAILVRNASDILEALQSQAQNQVIQKPLFQESPTPRRKSNGSNAKEKKAGKQTQFSRVSLNSLTADQRAVFEGIDFEPTMIDGLVEKNQLPIQSVLSILTVLQGKNLILRTSGNSVCRNTEDMTSS